MIVIRNQQELKNQNKQIKTEIFNSLEMDVEIIEENYTTISEEYGPLIIVIDEREESEMFNKFPIIKKLVAEDALIVFEDESEMIERVCYLLNDEGFIVYIRRKKEINV